MNGPMNEQVDAFYGAVGRLVKNARTNAELEVKWCGPDFHQLEPNHRLAEARRRHSYR